MFHQACPSSQEEGPRLLCQRTGATLVELIVCLILLAILFTGWVRINNVQALRKESLRYAAVEKAAGIMDAIDAEDVQPYASKVTQKSVEFQILPDGSIESASLWKNGSRIIRPFFNEDFPIGYQCHTEIVEDSNPAELGNQDVRFGKTIWLVVDLFDVHGDLNEHGETLELPSRPRPFTSLRSMIRRY